MKIILRDRNSNFCKTISQKPSQSHLAKTIAKPFAKLHYTNLTNGKAKFRYVIDMKSLEKQTSI